MPERNDTAAPGGSGAKRRGLLALGGVAVLGGVVAVLYGMGFGGKEGAAACPGREATLAKLDPLVHGEVAAFGLRKPALGRPGAVLQWA